MSDPDAKRERGPFRVDQLEDGDRYELTRGHPVYCAPGGRRHGAANATGALPLATDPAVTAVGVDVGYTAEPGTLRAPDLAVGGALHDEPGWAEGAPPLAVEYADRGTDERDLSTKIDELLAAGSRWVWVVRLVGEKRVEVHASGQSPRIVRAGEQLTAPGVLANPLPVEALWDPAVAMDASLRNLLQRRGYDSIESVRIQGLEQGIEQGIERGVAPLLHLYSRKLGRALTTAERGEIVQRLTTLGAERLGDAVLDLSADALAAWLREPRGK